MAEIDFKQRLAERITDVVARKYATVATAIVAPKEPYVKSRSKIPSLVWYMITISQPFFPFLRDLICFKMRNSSIQDVTIKPGFIA